jgi:hypothetical protein
VSELLPCPFCGSQPHLAMLGQEDYVFCSNEACGNCDNYVATAESWNHRTSNRTPAITQPESNEHKPLALPLGDAGKLVEALEGLLREAVILSREYLKAFDNYGPDDTIQGWDKARWLRAADAADFARETLSTHLAGTSKGDGE